MPGGVRPGLRGGAHGEQPCAVEELEVGFQALRHVRAEQGFLDAGRERAPDGQGVGADGLAVEVHPSPDEAMSDKMQQLDGNGFAALMDALGISRMRRVVDLVDREIVRLFARRRELSLAIGRVKAARGMPVQIPEREEELLAVIREEAVLQGLDPVYAERVFEEILADSRAAQWREREGRLRFG